jgi:serine/threonine-protein kinase
MIRPSRDDGLATQAGSALGSPAYMSPEQAAGRVEELGPATDTYGLGATLHCLLTGQPPFRGGDPGELLRKVSRGEWRPPRQVKGDVPAALEAVCLKAMALQPPDRYGSAQALAADVERWLGDEPVGAYHEALRARAGRWARRHRPLMAATAVGLLAAALAGGAGLWWLAQEAAERRQAVEGALAEVGRLQQQARWAEARVALDQAHSRLDDGGPESLRARLERARRELDLVADLDAIRLRRATWVEGRFDLAGADRRYAEVFQAAGMVPVGGDVEAAAAWVSAAGVREALVAALDDWAACAGYRNRRAWLLEVARRADPDPWRDRARDPAAWEDLAALARLARGEEVARQSPQLLAVLGMVLLPVPRDAEGLLRRAQARHPGDFWLNFVLGHVLQAGKKPAEAVAYYRAALAVRPTTPAVYNNLGNALHDQGKLEEAAAEFRRALALDPRYAEPHNGLGMILTDRGRREEAAAEFRRAIALAPRLAPPHNGLGSLLYEQGKVKEAAAEFRQALSLDPRDATAHYNLGNTLGAQGKPAEAVAEYRQALRLKEDEAEAHCNLGLLLQNQGQLAEALAHLKRGHELGSRRPGWPYPSAQWVRQCQHLLDLDARLPAILAGTAHPADAAEQVEFAGLCALKKRHADAARLYADAFAAEAKLAADLQAGHRYDAACCAALAAAGPGEGTDRLDGKQRGRWRQQALAWLRADLAAWAKVVQDGSPPGRAAAANVLRHWRQDTDLASVRDRAALARLPREERAAWERLWAEVAALLQKAGGQGVTQK